MPHYVILGNWTEQGIRNFRETPQRADAYTQLVEQLGGKVHNVYWTQGAHDIVSILEAPDDEAMAAISLALGSRGAIRTTTLRAFTRQEVESIIAQAPEG
jgi:uncharacterized protein with GYD domain